MKLDLEFRNTMPENVTPLEAVAMVKCLDEEGYTTWYKISTPDLNLMESMGMLCSAVIASASTVSKNWIDDRNDDDENKGEE